MLPFFLLYLVAKLGYDRRALVWWTMLTWALIPICFFLLPPPRPDAGLTPVNVNYVWGLNDATPQTWVSPELWLVGMMVLMPIVLFASVHVVLMRVMPKAPR